MKKTKYLVLSAAAILAVGCNGSKMANIADSEAVSIAEAIQDYHDKLQSGEETIPTALTINKTYRETYDANLFGRGKEKWVDEETYRIEIDLNKDNPRASIEIYDSDTAWDEYSTGPATHKKIDYVYKDGFLYYCFNYNDLSYMWAKIKFNGETACTKEQALEHIVSVLCMAYTISIPVWDPLYGAWDWDSYEITSAGNYLTGMYDITLDYVFENIVTKDDEEPMGFPGYLDMIADEDINIHTSTKAIQALIDAGGTYKEGSYAKYYYGSEDKEKKTSLYGETNSKLGYAVEDISEKEPYALGTSADCTYKTDMTFTYKDSFVSKTSFNHEEEFLYSEGGEKTNEYKRRTVTQDVELKLNAKIPDIDLNQYHENANLLPEE